MSTDSDFVSPPKPAPPLNIPSSTSTVTVRVIDTTSHISGSTQLILTPHIPGHDKISCPCFAFLITHPATGTHILFDLGVRKDYENLAPVVANRFTVGEGKVFDLSVDTDVANILDQDVKDGGVGVGRKDISAVVWSHHHWDHIGDMTTFPSNTSLIIGPGFQKEYLPGYPTNPNSALLDSDFAGRTVRELEESEFNLTLGRFPAHDYFGDGSFYLLHSPGHTVGHICGMARTTPDTFILMGGDACHHGGEFRPTEYLPLPKNVPAAPRSRFLTSGCPGALLVEKVHPNSSGTEPFYDIAKGFSHDHDEAKRSIAKLTEFDANENVLVCIAHDPTMIGGMDFYPKDCNNWKKEGVQAGIRWAFIGDFDVSKERLQPDGEGQDRDYSWLSGSTK